MDWGDRGDDMRSKVFQTLTEDSVFPKHYAMCSGFAKKSSTLLYMQNRHREISKVYFFGIWAAEDRWSRHTPKKVLHPGLQ